MTLKLGMQYYVLDYYQVCSNYALEVTLTYFTARSNLVIISFDGKNIIEEKKDCYYSPDIKK